MIFTFKLARRLALVYAATVFPAIVGCSGDLAVELLASSPPSVTSVVLSAHAVTLSAGQSVQLSAALHDSTGAVLNDRAVTWKSSAPHVADVSASGEVHALVAGVAMITASSDGESDSAVVTVTAETTDGGEGGGTLPRVGYYVTPAGSSGADGSIGRPWDLPTALAGAAGRLQPGDTVWLRAGTYRGDFRSDAAGASGRPIVFRQYPGERATIDGRLRVQGPDVAFWGFEIMNSAPLSNGKLPGLETHGARGQFINLVIHDVAQQGITFYYGATDSEVYGCIVYNNGTHENLDHGIYVHNSSGTKVVRDNVFFNNLAYGIHVYASPGSPTQRNVHVIGNVAFNNGTISREYPAKGNLHLGADVSSEGMRVVDNLLYFSGTDGENLRLGYTASSRDIVATGNLVWGGFTGLVVREWSTATIRDNIVGNLGDVVDLRDASTSGHQWSGNRYYRSESAAAWLFRGSAMSLSAWKSATGIGSNDVAQSAAPTSPTVIVRPNRFEPGRGHVVIYNWSQQSSVGVDLSGILLPGQAFEVFNVQNLFGNPVVRGTYGGGLVVLPMTGVAPPPRIGRSTPTPPRTGPRFDTFLVRVSP